MIKISLVVPVYNKESVIRKTLDSIVNGYDIEPDEFECILVNESSTDNSGEICKEYASIYPYFKVYSILNDGVNKPSNARNFGKKIASGQYIMFLDADDILCPNFIRSVVDFMDEQIEYDFYLCNRYINDKFCAPDLNLYEYVGPVLPACIFRKYVTDSLDFENIVSEDVVYTKKLLLLGYKYYYNEHNKPSYHYIEANSSMIFDDVEHGKKYDIWFCNPAEILQFYSKYNYCNTDKFNLKDKRKKPIQNLDILVTNHCNLNCWSCSSFCPLVEDKTPISIDYIKNELENIVRFRDDIRTITLLGGEPTLHPQLSEIFSMVRGIFPNNEIRLITNGTTYKTLYKLRESINRNHIIVSLSEYPIDNLDEIIDTFKKEIHPLSLELNEFAVKYGFCNNHLQAEKHNEIDKIRQCIKRIYCKRLEENRIYICHYCADVKVLKQYFGDEVKIDNNGTYIEINENTSINDISNFMNSQIPEICFHCADVLQENTDDKVKYLETYQWKKSNKELSEFYKK